MEQHVIQDKSNNPVNILIVEDDNDDYVLICHAFDDYGFNFHSSDLPPVTSPPVKLDFVTIAYCNS